MPIPKKTTDSSENENIMPKESQKGFQPNLEYNEKADNVAPEIPEPEPIKTAEVPTAEIFQ